MEWIQINSYNNGDTLSGKRKATAREEQGLEAPEAGWAAGETASPRQSPGQC